MKRTAPAVRLSSCPAACARCVKPMTTSNTSEIQGALTGLAPAANTTEETILQQHDEDVYADHLARLVRLEQMITDLKEIALETRSEVKRTNGRVTALEEKRGMEMRSIEQKAAGDFSQLVQRATQNSAGIRTLWLAFSGILMATGFLAGLMVQHIGK